MTGLPHAAAFGERLRAARIRAQLTQADVAERSGLSLSFIRLVEAGRSDISLARLLRWTTVFGLPVADLFSQPDGDPLLVVRPDQRIEIPSREAGLRFFLLSSTGDRDMEPGLFELEPGAAMQRPLVHDGEETAFVLRGCVRLTLGEQERTLVEGDAAYYDSRIPHRFSNDGRHAAALLVTTTHPRVRGQRHVGAREVRTQPASDIGGGPTE